MEIQTATQLIQSGVSATNTPQVWADLGCGAGTFTRALAGLLPADSHLHAVDLDARALSQIPAPIGSVQVDKLVADFAAAPLPFSGLDGVLMANSLHFVRDQRAFLEKMQPLLKTDGRWLVVEYDTDSPNRWVPFPLSFRSLERLFRSAGYGSVERLGSVPSVYNSNPIYAAVVQL